LIECGFPGTLPKLSAELKRKGARHTEIKYFLASHFHPNHAGLAQELKNQGIKLIVMEQQQSSIAELAAFFKSKKFSYHEIILDDNLNLKEEESLKALGGLGLNGEIIYTPDRSNHSVTLILDAVFAFMGDLQPIGILPEEETVSGKSWDTILKHKIRTIYPGYGNYKEIL
jgi:ribonuclease/clavin/mitogillin